MRKRIEVLNEEQKARFNEWADRWIDIGLRTGPADRLRFETAVSSCYRYARLKPPKVVVWCPSPLVVALAGPIASYVLQMVTGVTGTPVRGGVDAAVGAAVSGAVDAAVGDAVDAAVGAAVSGAVGDAVRGGVDAAVDAAVRGGVDAAVGAAVSGAVDAAVGAAVRDAVDAAVGDAVRGGVDAKAYIASNWAHYVGGQLWVGGWYYGGAWTSFFREVCGLELPGDLWDRARAYEATLASACWWWPHRDFVMVSERPLAIRRELVNPDRPRGWGSHRLHCADGPAIVWPDGWGIWSFHGVRVPPQVIEAPETLTASQIRDETNVEVRRVMVDRFGPERYIREIGAKKVHIDDFGTLWRADIANDEPLVMVEVINATPEADGSFKNYWIRVPSEMKTAHEAVAWTFAMPVDEYWPVVQT